MKKGARRPRMGGWILLLALGATIVPLISVRADGGEGKRIYASYCQSCHGLHGDGKGPKSRGLVPSPPDFTDPSFWKDKKDPYLFHVIQNGMGEMPGWSDTLSPDSIGDVLSYIRSFRP